MQFVGLAVGDDGVSGVVAALVTGHGIGLLGQIVNDFSFAFVTPLGADYDD